MIFFLILSSLFGVEISTESNQQGFSLLRLKTDGNISDIVVKGNKSSISAKDISGLTEVIMPCISASNLTIEIDGKKINQINTPVKSRFLPSEKYLKLLEQISKLFFVRNKNKEILLFLVVWLLFCAVIYYVRQLRVRYLVLSAGSLIFLPVIIIYPFNKSEIRLVTLKIFPATGNNLTISKMKFSSSQDEEIIFKYDGLLLISEQFKGRIIYSVRNKLTDVEAVSANLDIMGIDNRNIPIIATLRGNSILIENEIAKSFTYKEDNLVHNNSSDIKKGTVNFIKPKQNVGFPIKIVKPSRINVSQELWVYFEE